jgi:hypothetical protein
MRYAVATMGKVRIGEVAVVSKSLNRAGVITVLTALTQPVLFWDAQWVSKPDDC